MNQLSMESRIGLRKLGLSNLSYLLDKVLNKTNGTAEMTIADICTITGLSRRVVEKALRVTAIRNNLLPQPTRELQNEQTELMHHFELIESILYFYYVKTVQKVGHKQASIVRLPSSAEVDKVFGVTNPTYIPVRQGTYPHYKADITQFLIVVEPGLHSYSEIARAAGVSESTVRRHEVIAETTVVRHYAGVPMSQWDIDELPEDYNDYMTNKKFAFRGAWLEYNGVEAPYARTGYQKLLLEGGTAETIEVKWNKRGDHFARPDLVVERPVDEHEKKMFSLWADAVYQGKKTQQEYIKRFPKLFGWQNLPGSWQGDLV